MASDPLRRSEVLRALVHDLGNLAYRLTFLSANLEAQIPDPAQRGDAVALLRDTTERLRGVIARLREVGTDG